MIRFENLSALKALLERINTPPIGEALSANVCVLIEQLNQSTTQFTAIETNRAIFTRRLNHTGDYSGGDTCRYLLDQADLKQKLSRFKEASLSNVTFLERSGQLLLASNYRIDENGRAQEQGTISVRQYPGAISDFGPVFHASDPVGEEDLDEQDSEHSGRHPYLVAQMSAADFDIWVNVLYNFGEFSTDKRFEGDAISRTVMLDITSGQVRGTTNYKGAYAAYILLAGQAEVFSEVRIAIEGRQLKRLIGLGGETISIYVRERSNGIRWITFEGETGTCSLLAADPEHRFLQNYNLFDPDPRILTHAVRGYSIGELTSTVALQMPADTDQQQNLLAAEVRPKLVVMKAHNIRGIESSSVEPDPIASSGNWQPLVINSKAIKAALRNLKLFMDKCRIQSTAILLTQKKLQRASGTTAWMLFLSPALQAEALSANVMIFVNPAEENPNLLDADE